MANSPTILWNDGASNPDEVIKAEILDITGKTLGTYSGHAIANNTINIENLAQGIYLVKVTNTNNQIVTLRFIKE